MKPAIRSRKQKDQDQALIEFSEILAHRIRSLVASIEGYTDLLTFSLGTREQRELALRILEGTARIEQVLADLIQYSNPLEPVLVPVPLNDIIAEILLGLDESDRQVITIDSDPVDQAWIMADPRMLLQAFLVLIQNALEATKNQSKIVIEVKISNINNITSFNIWNQGHIRVEKAGEKVFQPFFTTKAQNLGIGLPIALRIVEAHGGSLYLSSNDEKKGICFTLELPNLCVDDVTLSAVFC